MEDFSNIVDNFKPLFPDNIQVKKAYLNFPDDDFAPEEKISKREMTEYKGFQMDHCPVWHVRCYVSRYKVS